MNPLTNVRNIQALNDRELELGLIGKKSWHDQYKDSAWVFIGGLPYDLNEGDILCVFSQYGEIVNLNLVRDGKSGKSKGFGFLCFEDQRSTILAVDNLNGFKILGRTIRVDHVENYRQPKEYGDEHEITKKIRAEGCAPKLESSEEGEDEEEEDDFVVPMKKAKKEKKSKKEKKKKKKKHRELEGDGSGDDSDVEKSVDKFIVKKEKVDRGYDKALSSDSNKNYEKEERSSSIKPDKGKTMQSAYSSGDRRNNRDQNSSERDQQRNGSSRDDRDRRLDERQREFHKHSDSFREINTKTDKGQERFVDNKYENSSRYDDKQRERERDRYNQTARDRNDHRSRDQNDNRNNENHYWSKERSGDYSRKNTSDSSRHRDYDKVREHDRAKDKARDRRRER